MGLSLAAPAQSPNAGQGWRLGTFAYGINKRGTVTGTALDDNDVHP